MVTKEVDVVVIGAGITGLVTTYLLKQKGLKVILVEKNDRVGGRFRLFVKMDLYLNQGLIQVLCLTQKL